jgi:hypothetical protein
MAPSPGRRCHAFYFTAISGTSRVGMVRRRYPAACAKQQRSSRSSAAWLSCRACTASRRPAQFYEIPISWAPVQPHSLCRIYEMTVGTLSNSYARTRTLPAWTHAAEQEQPGRTSMTAMGMRHELTADSGFWAGHDAGHSTRGNTRGSRALRRPDARILNEAIPLVAIGRNRAGLWIARDCDSSTGRAFIFKGSAIRFAKRMKAPGAYALMFVKDGLELASCGPNTHQFQKARLARTLLAWKARIRRFWRRLQGQTAHRL